MTCENIRDMLFSADRLSESVPSEIEKHTTGCPECQALLCELIAMDKALSAASLPAEKDGVPLHEAIAKRIETGDITPAYYGKRRRFPVATFVAAAAVLAIAVVGGPLKGLFDRVNMADKADAPMEIMYSVSDTADGSTATGEPAEEEVYILDSTMLGSIEESETGSEEEAVDEEVAYTNDISQKSRGGGSLPESSAAESDATVTESHIPAADNDMKASRNNTASLPSDAGTYDSADVSVHEPEPEPGVMTRMIHGEEAAAAEETAEGAAVEEAPMMKRAAKEDDVPAEDPVEPEGGNNETVTYSIAAEEFEEVEAVEEAEAETVEEETAEAEGETVEEETEEAEAETVEEETEEAEEETVEEETEEADCTEEECIEEESDAVGAIIAEAREYLAGVGIDYDDGVHGITPEMAYGVGEEAFAEWYAGLEDLEEEYTVDNFYSYFEASHMNKD